MLIFPICVFVFYSGASVSTHGRAGS